MFRVILITCLVAAAYATRVEKCDGGKPFPREVRVIGCDEPPCAVIKGKSVNFEVDFSAEKPINSMTTSVRATVFGITVAFELPEDVKKTCDHLDNGDYCPLDEGEDVTYLFEFPIAKVYPEIQVGIEISVADDESDSIFCFKCDIQVKSG